MGSASPPAPLLGTRARLLIAALVAVVVVLAIALVVSVLTSRDRSAGATGATGAGPGSAGEGRVAATCRHDADSDLDRVQSAIDASEPGDTVVFRGHCLLSGTLVLRATRTYTGQAATADEDTGAILEQAPGTEMEALVASESWSESWKSVGPPLTVTDLKLLGTGDRHTTGLVLRNWISVVRGVHVKGFGGDGIALRNEAADHETGLDSTMVNGRITDSFVTEIGRHGIAIEDSVGDEGPQGRITDWYLLRNAIGGTGGDGIHLENAAGWQISENHVYGIRGTGISVERAWGTGISDNYVEDFGTGAEPGTHRGIVVTLMGDHQGSTILGNRIFRFHGKADPEARYEFLSVSGVYGTGAAVITGNLIRAAPETAARAVGVDLSTGSADALEVVSSANAILGFPEGAALSAGPGVSVSAGE